MAKGKGTNEGGLGVEVIGGWRGRKEREEEREVS